MKLSEWAEEHARALLSPLGQRWRHAHAVATAARELARQLHQDEGDALISSAYLHDIGYSQDLSDSGFHPLDGAQQLRALGHERLAGLVAHHTGAKYEAELRGLQDELTAFDDERSNVSAALAFCDLTTGPSGESVTPEVRLLDVEARYGQSSPVTAGLKAAWPELMDSVGVLELPESLISPQPM